MQLVIKFILLGWIAVHRADLINAEKCERDAEFCEQFSFRRSQHNNSNMNNSLESSKPMGSGAVQDLGLAVTHMMLEQAHSQENGKLSHKTLDYSTIKTFRCQAI